MFSSLRIKEWLAQEIESASPDPSVVKMYLREVVNASNFLKEHWDEPGHGIQEEPDDDGRTWSGQ